MVNFRLGPVRCCLCALLLSLAAAPWATASATESGVPRQRQAAPLSSVQRLDMPALDLAGLAQEDQLRQAAGEPWRYAVPQPTRVSLASQGSWQNLEDGNSLWRMRISAPGARSLSFGFTRYHLPTGARLLIYAEDESSSIRPFTAADNHDHGELWTPPLSTDEVVLELTVPQILRDLVELEVGFVNQGYRGFSSPTNTPPGSFQTLIAKSGSCNVDVVCPEGNSWRKQIRSVALYSIRGSIACTGTLLNNTAGDLRPFFLTANHCGISTANDQTIVVFWNYQNSSCRASGSSQSGGQGNGSLSRFQSGATLRAHWDPTDFALIELDDAPNPSFNVFWAGWDRGTGSPPSAVGIHHPSGEEKRISFENNPLRTTSRGGNSSPGDGRFLRVADWDLGTTEPGSSGSALFSPQKRVIGQLFGGLASCGNDDPDWYGRLSGSWNGGGSSSTRLRDWLDPSGTGTNTLDGRDSLAEDPLEIPTDLTATVLSATEIQLTWQDNSTRESDFLVQTRLASEPDFRTLRTVPANTTSLSVPNLEPNTEYLFRIRARRGSLKSPFTAAVSATTLGGTPAPPTQLSAISASTSQVMLTWNDESSDETEFQVDVSTDGETFARATTVPADSTGTVLDGFPPLAHRFFRIRAANASGASAYSNTARTTTDGIPGPCTADDFNLCLNGDRFRISVQSTTRSGTTGPGHAQGLTDDTGYFWFFSPSNVEMTLKVLNGCPSNSHYWVFAAGLTNIRVEMLVLDTETGRARTYINPPRTPFQPILDTAAFATCP